GDLLVGDRLGLLGRVGLDGALDLDEALALHLLAGVGGADDDGLALAELALGLGVVEGRLVFGLGPVALAAAAALPLAVAGAVALAEAVHAVHALAELVHAVIGHA